MAEEEKEKNEKSGLNSTNMRNLKTTISNNRIIDRHYFIDDGGKKIRRSGTAKKLKMMSNRNF